MAFKRGQGTLFRAHTYLVSRGHAKGIESDIRNRLVVINTEGQAPYMLLPSEVCIHVNPTNM